MDREPSDETTRPVDPLQLFVDRHRRALPTTRGRKRFNAAEHVWLGGYGAAQALEELRAVGLELSDDLIKAIPRRDDKEVLDYGELVALSGDFYGSPDELFDEKPSLLPWLWESKDLSDLRQIFEEELRWIRTAPQDRTTSYPDFNIRMAWNTKGYLELALQNTDHFGWHNIRAYCRHHGTALDLARSARGQQDERFRRALYTNAFADHFLTDAFAAGHVRVPRAEIRTWAGSKGLDEKIAGVLSKILHDQDGHVDLRSLHGTAAETDRPPSDGLEVTDSTGSRWVTRCDGQLFLEADAAGSTAVKRPIAAVAASLKEVLLAWQKGDMPRMYEATRFVPRPAPGAKTLIDKFPAGMSEDELGRLWEAVGWYAKWLGGFKREHIEMLLAALPALMDEFRRHVAQDIAADPAFAAKVAPKYLQAFQKIA